MTDETIKLEQIPTEAEVRYVMKFLDTAEDLRDYNTLFGALSLYDDPKILNKEQRVKKLAGIMYGKLLGAIFLGCRINLELVEEYGKKIGAKPQKEVLRMSSDIARVLKDES